VIYVGGYTIPSAQGAPDPVWPLDTEDRKISDDFGDPRADGKRVHVAEDLPAPRGTIVRATEAGKILHVHGFTSRPAHRADTEVLLLGTDTNVTIAYGEILPHSWMEFVQLGQAVRAGDPIGRVGGLDMLHFEIYEGHQRTTQRWMVGEPPPPALRDPTPYLIRAASQTPRPKVYLPPPPPITVRPPVVVLTPTELERRAFAPMPPSAPMAGAAAVLLALVFFWSYAQKGGARARA